MKRIYIIYWVLLGILQAGCREDIELYSGTAGIYFAMSIKYGGWNDSELDYTSTSEIPFAVDEREDTVLQVRAKIIGSIANYDRIGLYRRKILKQKQRKVLISIRYLILIM